MDVLHAFYIPDFRTKIDVIPNRYTSMWFQALDPNPERIGPDGKVVKDKDGNIQYVDHHVFCAEYCGDNHSDMWAYIRVLSEADYKKKKEELLGVPSAIKNDPVKRGEFWAKALGCTNCHPMEAGKVGSAPFWGRMWGQTEHFVDGSSIDLSDDTGLLQLRAGICLQPRLQGRPGVLQRHEQLHRAHQPGPTRRSHFLHEDPQSEVRRAGGWSRGDSPGRRRPTRRGRGGAGEVSSRETDGSGEGRRR